MPLSYYLSAYKGIPSSFRSGFNKWGFVIIRGVYDNEAAWDTFMKLLKDSTTQALQRRQQEEELGPHCEWTVIEDRQALENASKDTARARFREWVDARSVERDGPGADLTRVVECVPRFRCCIYVDKASFGSLSVRADGPLKAPTHWTLNGQVVLIDGMHVRHTEEEEEDDDVDSEEQDSEDEGPGFEEYKSVDGDTAYDVGWMYVNVIELEDLYDQLFFNSHDWEAVYRGRRPGIGSEPGKGQPLQAAVDRDTP
ncbi:hypothetical protein LIA77_11126 [Sarocladium implicatum]|nr:hypothetical protein LIA77_11126 [Sarocladium implicatum]